MPTRRRNVSGLLVAAVGLVAGYDDPRWLVAASVVVPPWLRAVGVPAPVPNRRHPSLANHLPWGTVFGGDYAWLVGRSGATSRGPRSPCTRAVCR